MHRILRSASPFGLSACLPAGRARKRVDLEDPLEQGRPAPRRDVPLIGDVDQNSGEELERVGTVPSPRRAVGQGALRV